MLALLQLATLGVLVLVAEAAEILDRVLDVLGLRGVGGPDGLFGRVLGLGGRCVGPGRRGQAAHHEDEGGGDQLFHDDATSRPRILPAISRASSVARGAELGAGGSFGVGVDLLPCGSSARPAWSSRAAPDDVTLARHGLRLELGALGAGLGARLGERVLVLGQALLRVGLHLHRLVLGAFHAGGSAPAFTRR